MTVSLTVFIFIKFPPKKLTLERIKCHPGVNRLGVFKMSTRLFVELKEKECRPPDLSLTASTHLLRIQTILSVLELRQISTFVLADFTADREFHPALKTLSRFNCLSYYNKEFFKLSILSHPMIVSSCCGVFY